MRLPKSSSRRACPFERNGGVVHYLPLYLLPFIVQDAKGPGLGDIKLPEVDWAELLG